MTTLPLYLQDDKQGLTDKGFAISNVWYHGTSSALLPSILEFGLKRSGDNELNQAAQKTMATIGNQFTPTQEPVFLTQSKELAYYWATQAIRDRSVRFEGEEEPVVLAVTLDEKLQAQVKPDVGAMSLLLMDSGEHFMAHLASIYEQRGVPVPDIDLKQADRMDFLTKLGMAYINQNIDAKNIKLVSEVR
ncbi:hypothetical protein [Alginatibacterium sediminis]|nr:hypothetical protein [Alginatibacterium sediminis]